MVPTENFAKIFWFITSYSCTLSFIVVTSVMRSSEDDHLQKQMILLFSQRQCNDIFAVSYLDIAMGTG